MLGGVSVIACAFSPVPLPPLSPVLLLTEHVSPLVKRASGRGGDLRAVSAVFPNTSVRVVGAPLKGPELGPLQPGQQ